MREFRDTQPAGEQHLDDGTVAVSLPFGQVDGLFQEVDFSRGKDLRQVVRLFGRLQQLCRVCFHIAVKDKKTIELAYTAEDAGQRAGTDAEVGDRCSEVLQLLQRHIRHGHLLAGEIAQELVHIMQIGIQGIGRTAFLQFQITAETADNIL